jgi:hypothetical protein
MFPTFMMWQGEKEEKYECSYISVQDKWTTNLQKDLSMMLQMHTSVECKHIV